MIRTQPNNYTQMDLPPSLVRDISPPRPLKRRKTSGFTSPSAASSPQANNEPTIAAILNGKVKLEYRLSGTVTQIARPKQSQNIEPTLAAIEAGKAKIDDHLTYFTNHLAAASRATPPPTLRLSITDFASLYHTNQHAHGHHFVIHQHNHPKAGLHYDLRLQFSATSSISFAIPKGLPGNPNSRSIGRMAIETRVHNYWNHLIESASRKTGSLLIWDTGTYAVLPRAKKGGRMPSPMTTDDEGEDEQEDVEGQRMGRGKEEYENDKLVAAFQSRYIRLRLNGTRLLKDYTVILRLPSNEIGKRPTARRKRNRKAYKSQTLQANETSDSESELDETHVRGQEPNEDLDTDSDEDAQTRASNAYPGSTNDIGSMHQRHWFLQLDRQNSGFVLDKSSSGKGVWIRRPAGGGFEPFLVRGRDYERSVVTGRLAKEVESDEGVEGFVGRGGWMGIEH